ncbi:hypothetical protein CEW46_31885, partial [Bacillus cereus]
MLNPTLLSQRQLTLPLLSDMINSTQLIEGMVVTTLGAGTVNDGQGSAYLIKSVSGTENGSTIINLANGLQAHRITDNTRFEMNEKFQAVSQAVRSLLRNSDFEASPFIQSRSSIYSFSAGITSPSYNNKKSFKMTCTGYETSSDPNKDFAMLLMESLTSSEKLRISFLAYPTSASKTMNIRMAYSGGSTVNLGPANSWNRITLTLDLTSMTQTNNYLYFNMLSSYTVYL